MSITKNDVARFPAWGPYSKKYMGISHLPQHERRAGVRFDFSTVPALSHLDIHLPNVTLPTGWRAWSAAPDLSVYSYRVDLQGLDDVYGEVFYGSLDDHTILVRTELTNHTDLIQDLMINYFSSIEYPQTQYTDVQILPTPLPVLGIGRIVMDINWVKSCILVLRGAMAWEMVLTNGICPNFSSELSVPNKATGSRIGSF